jgi:hypothetical protein
MIKGLTTCVPRTAADFHIAHTHTHVTTGEEKCFGNREYSSLYRLAATQFCFQILAAGTEENDEKTQWDSQSEGRKPKPGKSDQ